MHKRVRQFKTLVTVCGLLAACVLLLGAAHAQDDTENTCATVARQILQAVNAVCEDVGRDQLCYGNISVEASPSAFASSFAFEQEGDTVGVGDIATLRLQTRSFENLEWGVALAKLQVTDDTGLPQDVTLLLFGNIELENTGAPLPEVPGTVTATERVNVRIGPSGGSADAGRLDPGQAVTANGVFTNEAGEQWIRIAFADAPGGIAWVLGSLLQVDGGTEALPTLESATDGAFGPMQAFTFSSGAGVDGCGEEAESGLLVQTPAGVGEVNFLINEIDFQIGSDAFIQAVPSEQMAVTTLSGNVRASAAGVTRSIPRGARGSIPLDEAGNPSGEPELPEPVALDDVDGFEVFQGVGLFEDSFELEPFEEDCLAEYNAAFNEDGGDLAGVSGDCVGTYYDEFADEFAEDLGDECFGEGGSVFNDCLSDLTDLVVEECGDGEEDAFCDELLDEDGTFDFDDDDYYGTYPDGDYDDFEDGYDEGGGYGNEDDYGGYDDFEDGYDDGGYGYDDFEDGYDDSSYDAQPYDQSYDDEQGYDVPDDDGGDDGGYDDPGDDGDDDGGDDDGGDDYDGGY